MKLDRRSFLKTGAVILGGASLLVAEADRSTADDTQTASNDRFILHIHCYDRSGRLVPAVPGLDVDGLYVMDLDYDIIHRDIKNLGTGVYSVALPSQAFALAIPSHVPDFGYMWLFADNDGKGYAADGIKGELNLSVELACSRIAVVRRYLSLGKAEGCVFSSKARRELSEASALLRKAKAEDPSDRQKAAELAYASLSKSMWAGERIAVELARHRIERLGGRRGFRFGCNAFKYSNPEGEYEKHFRQIFDYGTLGFYWRGFEPTQGKPQWDRLDRMADLLREAGIEAKGHPLIWLHQAGVPDWLEDKSFENFYRLSRQRIADIVSHYRGKIDIWDVINEAHDFANILGFEQEQLGELTKMACEATSLANPNATRIINNTMMWGEYAVPRGSMERRKKWTPHRYVADIIESGIEFEVIGIQMYYFHYDMLEIDQMFERFSKFGKPIHITEIGVSSSSEEDSVSHVKNPHGLWHKPWSEEVQADYMEQFYTIAYSKPYIEAITYWDFSDDGGHFWPHGGFLGPGHKPKESFYRMRDLIAKWRSTKPEGD